ncbi:MAG: hypothetical protein OXL41_03365 [Nitrospinae bacterium]|nr:hypothetical protein [Nitrospinota bacterium]
MVGELIELLRRYPEDLRVVVNGYENGYDDLTPGRISTEKISLETGKHEWEGRHGEPPYPKEESPDGAEIVEALVLRRTSN